MEAFIICEETNGSAERVLAKYAIDHARAGGGGGREGGGGGGGGRRTEGTCERGGSGGGSEAVGGLPGGCR